METEGALNAAYGSFRICPAERTVKIRPTHDAVRAMCRGYEIPWRDTADITVEVTSPDIVREAEAARGETRKKVRERRYTEEYPETPAVPRKIASAMPAFDTLLMHGAVISTRGRGYMITAPSGVGRNANASVPMKAIFPPERSDRGNTVEEVPFAEAFPLLAKRFFRPDRIETKIKTLRLLNAMAGETKVFRFRSEPAAEAVLTAWKTAGGDLWPE